MGVADVESDAVILKTALFLAHAVPFSPRSFPYVPVVQTVVGSPDVGTSDPTQQLGLLRPHLDAS